MTTDQQIFNVFLGLLNHGPWEYKKLMARRVAKLTAEVEQRCVDPGEIDPDAETWNEWCRNRPAALKKQMQRMTCGCLNAPLERDDHEPIVRGDMSHEPGQVTSVTI